jgi:predicted amidohydrolase
MKIALIQTELIWENPKENREILQNKINSISQYVDMLVLPEMFTSGFTMHPEKVAETMQGETISWLKEIAKSKNCAITGSLVISENGNFYNRLVFVFPDGKIETYDKRHLFTLAGEHEVYTAGNEKLIVEYKGFKICLLICYDLRFPVFSRNTEHYDILLYVANWPKVRTNAWDVLLQARAIENMCFVVGVNRVGLDGNNHEYIGHSQAIDFLGNSLIKPQEKEGIFYTELNKNDLLQTRIKLPFLDDRDPFGII